LDMFPQIQNEQKCLDENGQEGNGHEDEDEEEEQKKPQSSKISEFKGNII
jgi:hypothetical protein